MSDWRWRAIATAIVGAIVSSLGPACATDVDASCTGDTSPSGDPCSTGPEYAPRQSFAIEGTKETFCRRCTPHCGAHPDYPFAVPLVTALPSGSCTNEGASCDMGASEYDVCTGVARACNRDAFRCRCVRGEWACVIIAQGAGGCGCLRDAGPNDASTDAD